MAFNYPNSPLRDKSRSFPKAEGFNPQGCSYFLDDLKAGAWRRRSMPPPYGHQENKNTLRVETLSFGEAAGFIPQGLTPLGLPRMEQPTAV